MRPGVPPIAGGKTHHWETQEGRPQGKRKGTGRAIGAARGRPVGRGRGTASAGGTTGVSSI
jgi:hypothetical protein